MADEPVVPEELKALKHAAGAYAIAIHKMDVLDDDEVSGETLTEIEHEYSMACFDFTNVDFKTSDPAGTTIVKLIEILSRSEQETARLKALLNTPETEEFDKAIPLEAAHQIERWGAAQDAGKNPSDWFWLVGYLAGKALASHIAGNTDKAKHHCISTAAVLRNWHAHIRSGETTMRPGIAAERTVGAMAE